MKRYVLLFRGINVGGKNILPMKTLRERLESLGFRNVTTYIQSGNVVLDAQKRPSDEVIDDVERGFGFRPDVMVLEKTEFEAAMRKNPFSDPDGKRIHFYFCARPPKPDTKTIESLAAADEKLEVNGRVAYLYAPSGIGRSKLAARLEQCLGTPCTGRNLNTIAKLAAMLDLK